MEVKTDYSNIKFRENGRLKLLIIVGTRPEIIRLAAVINKCRKYFDCLLVHTGQNYDYNLNGIFFRDLQLRSLMCTWMLWAMTWGLRWAISSMRVIS